MSQSATGYQCPADKFTHILVVCRDCDSCRDESTPNEHLRCCLGGELEVLVDVFTLKTDGEIDQSAWLGSQSWQ